jgi:hypothetical protein
MLSYACKLGTTLAFKSFLLGAQDEIKAKPQIMIKMLIKYFFQKNTFPFINYEIGVA